MKLNEQMQREKVLWGLEKTEPFGQSSEYEAKVTEKKQAEIVGWNQNVKDFDAMQ